MIIVFRPDATPQQIDHVAEKVREWGLKTNISRGAERTLIGVIGDEAKVRAKPLEVFPGVEAVMPVLKPYRLVSAEARSERTRITLPGPPGATPVVIGGPRVVVIAGPCSIESREMLMEVGRIARDGGAQILRAGAFKPRTSPYAFQGHGVRGLKYLAEARLELCMPVVTEVMDTRDAELVGEAADMLQIGARNMQNFTLLKAVGRLRKPVLLKRGLSSTLEELLMCAEYLMSAGCHDVLLCERGIRTFEPMTRNTLDLSAIPVLKRESHLPVLADPSHGTGHWDLVGPMARAAVAAGADGITLEIHPRPEEAFSDGPQALLPKTYRELVKSMAAVAAAVGRSL
ncbi:MAG: 3-deoxy-7-phosphoheptulonate synthase [Candidatus Marinimicrobia bacterium]|nr:3-deoxy-7-phosphoheptulonate synthase [Candidatus Neomarinimicrobiota bacterium]